jgi:hypothetical protein
MEILDKHFMVLPNNKKFFVMIIPFAYFVVGAVSYMYGLTTLIESVFAFIIGILFSELIKLQYRVEYLEKKRR